MTNDRGAVCAGERAAGDCRCGEKEGQARWGLRDKGRLKGCGPRLEFKVYGAEQFWVIMRRR